MPALGGRGNPKRHPSLKCTLKTKAVPRGSPAKGAFSSHIDPELQAILHQKRIINQPSFESNDEAEEGFVTSAIILTETRENVFEKWKLRDEGKENVDNAVKSQNYRGKNSNPTTVVTAKICEFRDRIEKVTLESTSDSKPGLQSPVSSNSHRTSKSFPESIDISPKGTSEAQTSGSESSSASDKSLKAQDIAAMLENKLPLSVSEKARDGPYKNTPVHNASDCHKGSGGKPSVPEKKLHIIAKSKDLLSKPVIPTKSANGLSNKPAVPKKNVDTNKLKSPQSHSVHNVSEKPKVPEKPAKKGDAASPFISEFLDKQMNDTYHTEHLKNPAGSTSEKGKSPDTKTGTGLKLLPPKPKTPKPLLRDISPQPAVGTYLQRNNDETYDDVVLTLDGKPQVTNMEDPDSGHASPVANNEGDENNWKDCEPSETNQTKHRRVLVGQQRRSVKTKSPRRPQPRLTHQTSLDQTFIDSYDDVVILPALPAEDSDGWQTESDDEDPNDGYEYVEINDAYVSEDFSLQLSPSAGTGSPVTPRNPPATPPSAPPRRKSLELKALNRSSSGSSAITKAIISELTLRSDLRSSPESKSALNLTSKNTAPPVSPKCATKRQPSSQDKDNTDPEIYVGQGQTAVQRSNFRSSLTSSPSSVSTLSSSSTSSTSSGSSTSSSFRSAAFRPAPPPKPPLDSERPASSCSGSSFSSDKPPLPPALHKKSKDYFGDQMQENGKAPQLPPRNYSKEPQNTKNQDVPPVLPPPRTRWPKPSSHSVSTSKEAITSTMSKSPDKIYQGQSGQDEGQQIPANSMSDVVPPTVLIRDSGCFSDNDIDRYRESTASSKYTDPDYDTDAVPPSFVFENYTRQSSTDSDGKDTYLRLMDCDLMGESEDYETSVFENEPLYQIYHCGVVAREVWENNSSVLSSDDEDSEDYPDCSSLKEDDIQNVYGTLQRIATGQTSKSELQSTLQTLARGSQNFRTLWCETPEVKERGLTDTMSQKDIRFQESLFEIITSEASYLKSLSLFLDKFFYSAIPLGDYSVISESERKELISNLPQIRHVSERFMKELEAQWKKNPLLTTEICDVIAEYASKDFTAYVTYCGNLVYQERILRKLRESNEKFQQLVAQFESQPECNSLPLATFLTLPMQRITRLPLLVDNVSQRNELNTKDYERSHKALLLLQKLVRCCNERVHQMDNIELIAEIDRSLDFKKTKKIAIVSQSRSLVKKGKLTRILKETKGFLGSKKKESLYLFLFNDFLIVTKSKSSSSASEPSNYQVIDYANRIALEATVIDGSNFLKWLPQGVPNGCHNLFVLALLDNHEHKHAEFYFACDSLSERMRWVQAFTPVQQVSEDEKIYEAWDCPQVQVIHRYVARQPDELSLEESDVINVLRKVADGWYEGERIRDGERGWFPANHVVEIQSAHVRARNLRQRYRLLALSQQAIIESNSPFKT